MNSVVVENIIQTGEWVCDLERAKKARLLPDDVWVLIKSYAIPLNKCASCSKVGGINYCLPSLHYEGSIPKLINGGRELMRNNREKLKDDDIVFEKNIKSVRLCYDCSFKWVYDGGKHTGLSFYRSSITDPFEDAFETIRDMFNFLFEKMYPFTPDADKKQLSKRTKNLNKLKSSCLFDLNYFLNELHSCWFEYIKNDKNDADEAIRQQLEYFNEQIDDLIRYDIEEQINDKYTGLFLKTIATAYAIGKMDTTNYIELTGDIIRKHRNCRTEEEGIERLTKLEELTGIKL